MEPEDVALDDLDDFDESSDPDDSSLDFDHFDEHMDPFDDGPFYRSVDDL